VRRLRAFAVNLAVVLASVVLFAALLELVVFRFIWLASDAPRLDYVADVVRFAPNQEGVWRVRNEIAGAYRINAQGWNSGVGDYTGARRADVDRIAVVGDSYVEAVEVANTASLGEALGSALEDAGGGATEVYRFGISGAPLSQYVHMVEREVVGYRPDWIVVVVIHNDFDESYRFVQGRYRSSFMKFQIEHGEVVGEDPPTPWQAGAFETLRRLATVRFLLYRWQVRPQALVDLFLARGDGGGGGDTPYAANVEIGRVLAERREVEAVADHAARRLQALAEGIGARLLMVMDGDRYAIYGGDDESPALELNRLMADAAARHGIPFVDLHPVFAAHWAAHGERFNFATDSHWNELGHAIAGMAVAERIRAER
jgi:hypothetical protein